MGQKSDKPISQQIAPYTPEEFFERIDGRELCRQRSLLYNLKEVLEPRLTEEQAEDLEGVINLVETIADIASDQFGLPTMFTDHKRLSRSKYRYETKDLQNLLTEPTTKPKESENKQA